MVNVVDCAHYTEDGFEEDRLGFYSATCSCGWKCPPSPDVETAADFLMQHAYEAGTGEVTGRERIYAEHPVARRGPYA